MEKKSDIVDERVRASLLFDYYGELLNENQRVLCSRYLLDDLSFSEIADDAGISRQGVHDKVKRSIRQMEVFEENLKLIQKKVLIEMEISSIKSLLADSKEKEIKHKVEDRLNHILDLSE